MPRPRSLVAALALCAAAFASAQQISVEYVSGRADALQGAGWVPLTAGATVGADATLRLGPDSVVQLAAGSGRVTLAAPGSYALGELIVRRASTDRSLAAFLQSAVRTLLAPPKAQGAPLGARAGEVKETEAWADEDEATLERAQGLLRDGRLEEARALLVEARKHADPAGPFDFLLAWSAALEGRSGIALSILRRAELDASMQFHGEALALRAQLALEAEAPAEAETAARAYLADYPLGSQAQDCLLIQGLALRTLGSEAAAVAALQSALRMGKDTPSGQLAAAALRS